MKKKNLLTINNVFFINSKKLILKYSAIKKNFNALKINIKYFRFTYELTNGVFNSKNK